MSSIDTAVYTRLAACAGLTALVSTRIYAHFTPQNATYPCVVHNQISGPRQYVMGEQNPIVRARWQLDSYAATSVAARAVSEQVRLALSNYHGTSDSVVIDHVEQVNELSDYNESEELHRVIQDFMIDFRETTP